MKWSGIALAVVFTALLLQDAASQASHQSATGSPSPFIFLTNQYFQPTNTVLALAENAQPVQPLKPGSYQTHPYAMLLIVPKPVKDDCKIKEPQNTDFRMPILRPKTEIIPESTVEK